MVLTLEAQAVAKTVHYGRDVHIGGGVYAENRLVSPRMFQVSKQDLRKMLQHLSDRLDELS